jgi:hypothetical protein
LGFSHSCSHKRMNADISLPITDPVD